MRPRIQEQQDKLLVILLPKQKPIRLHMALPRSRIIPRKFVRLVLHRQPTVKLQQGDDLVKLFQRQSPLLAQLQERLNYLVYSMEYISPKFV